MTRFLVDAYDLGRNTKGVHRVLSCLLPELAARHGDLVVATTSDGVAHLRGVAEAQVVVVPVTRKSRWEQQGLPGVARRTGAAASYSHREAGALWGPPLLLHVPEDPEVRWAREPVADATDRARRAYSRLLMGRSLRRAAVVAASVGSVADELGRRHRVPVRTIPLGVDLGLFTPAPSPHEGHVLHLGSPDPRDRTELAVRAWARARREVALPPLVVAGSLGDEVGTAVRRVAAEHGETDAVRVPGRVPDDELAELYRQALVVLQPASDEGFGLQPLEALASGAPLVVADAPAVRDVVGTAARVVRAGRGGPDDADALTTALVALARDGAERERLREAGPVAAAAFTWGATADVVLAGLTRAARSQG